MPTLTFTFDTGVVPLSRITNAIATMYHYTGVFNSQPETKADFAKRIIK